MRRPQRPLRGIPALTAGLLVLSGCHGDEDATENGRGETSAGSITVFAAASLHEVFEEIGELYTEENGTGVSFNFAGSSGLVEQLEHGAPADVLATADKATMDSAMDSGLLAGEPGLFAKNHLVIVTPAGNPTRVQSLDDLEGEDVETVLCAAQVPCGAASQRVLESAGLEISPVSEETSVTDVLGRVRTGEADAGLVYATDALQGGQEVEAIEIQGADDKPNLYPIGITSEAEEPTGGQKFIDFVLDDERSQEIFSEAGFSEAR